MSSPFLIGFSEAIVQRLLEDGLLETEASTQEVAGFVAGRLAGAGEGQSLISSLSAALIACPHVEELFADDLTLKELVTDLPHDSIDRGPR